MRSGYGDNDTYAVFLTERLTGHHQHFDINNFIIYKHGYRALDSGTRPQPGLHLSHYYARTVAHNCVTIRMPGEEMPHYWGAAAANEDAGTPVPNDGGQCNRVDGKLLSYEEGPIMFILPQMPQSAITKQKRSKLFESSCGVHPISS